jgi:hypothetical protein
MDGKKKYGKMKPMPDSGMEALKNALKKRKAAKTMGKM